MRFDRRVLVPKRELRSSKCFSSPPHIWRIISFGRFGKDMLGVFPSMWLSEIVRINGQGLLVDMWYYDIIMVYHTFQGKPKQAFYPALTAGVWGVCSRTAYHSCGVPWPSLAQSVYYPGAPCGTLRRVD